MEITEGKGMYSCHSTKLTCAAFCFVERQTHYCVFGLSRGVYYESFMIKSQ